MRKSFLIAALAVALGSWSVSAQTDPDHRYVADSYASGLAEIELGKLAQTRGSNTEAKEFAQRLVTDHTRFNDELKTLAATKNITLATKVDATHQATYDRLSKLSASAFDRAFMAEMVTAHQKAVEKARQTSASATDAEVKAWAAKTLPTLEGHLKAAEKANAAVGGRSN